MRSARFWLSLAFSFALVGCADDAAPPLSPVVRGNVLVDAALLPPPERFQWEIGKQIEGFGGVYADSSGGLVTLTTDLGRADALREVVQARVVVSNSTARTPAGRARPMRVTHAQFTYRSLLSWKNALSMSDASGIIDGIGVIESKNRILVLVRDPRSISLIRQNARAIGIPDNAFVVARTQTHPAQSIQTGYFRPTTGGIRINAGSPGDCTLWGNAVRDGVRYGITASHCTAVKGSVTPSTVVQGGGTIGVEAIDPPWNVRERHPQCISGTLGCRYSDAAAFVYSESSSEKTIARISGSPCGFACYGPTTAIAPNRINSWVVDYPVDGEIVDKVGQRTGWSRGWVEGSCFDIRVDNYRHLCSVRVVASAHFGDSGAPVFFMYGDYARPTGILWGRDKCRNTFPNLDDGSCPAPGYEDLANPGNAFYMSAWWAIRQELGFSDASVGWP